METMNVAVLATLRKVGFTFPECLGQSLHPFLDESGQPRDPRLVGFEPCTTGGGNNALCMETGRFRIILTSDCGGIPTIEEWETALINIDVDASEAHGYDLLCITGQEWKQIVMTHTSH